MYPFVYPRTWNGWKKDGFSFCSEIRDQTLWVSKDVTQTYWNFWLDQRKSSNVPFQVQLFSSKYSLVTRWQWFSGSGNKLTFNISWWSFVRIWFWNSFQRQHIYTSSWNPYLPIGSWAAQKDPLHDVSNQVLARGKKSKFSKQDDPKFTHLLGLSQLFDHRSMIFTTDPVIAIGGHLLG